MGAHARKIRPERPKVQELRRCAAATAVQDDCPQTERSMPVAPNYWAPCDDIVLENGRLDWDGRMFIVTDRTGRYLGMSSNAHEAEGILRGTVRMGVR